MAETQIKFDSLELFSTEAEQWATEVGKEGLAGEKLEKNLPSQVRKFYDEILKFHGDIRRMEDRKKRAEEFKLLLPYMKMLNAKVAYAEARKVVTSKFASFIKQCISHLDENKPETLDVVKTFFEAFMGFYKLYAVKHK